MFLIHVGLFAMALAACRAQYVVSSSRRGQVDAVAMAVLLMVGLALGSADAFLDLPLAVMAAAGVGYVVVWGIVAVRVLVDTRRLEREVADLQRGKR